MLPFVSGSSANSMMVFLIVKNGQLDTRACNCATRADGIKSCCFGGAHPSDEVFPPVKCRMFARGNPFILGLVANGDAGWEVRQ
jgi:hypothetical protein